MKKIISVNNLQIFSRIYDNLLRFLLRYFNQKSLKNLQKDTANAAKVQQKVLKDILKLQKNTEYGKKYNFGAIESVAEFQTIHPLTNYEHYRSLVEDIANTGNFTQLVAQPISWFNQTSATTGKAKLIPVTKSLIKLANKFMQASFGMMQSENFPNTTNGRALRFSNAEELKLTPSGIPRGAASSTGMRKSWLTQKIMTLICTSPYSVFLISDYRTAYYCHWLFGLQEEDLGFITGNFASNLLGGLEILEKMWPQLVNDIEYGRIDESLELDASIRKELQKNLKPNPDRALTLRAKFEKGMKGIIPRIWPRLSHIQAITTGSMQIYNERLQFYAGDTLIYSAAYAASEGFVGLNLDPQREIPAYSIAPDMAFFEFIPFSEVSAARPTTVDLTSLAVGESYELVMTTVAGLYRYRMGDVVKCVGYYNHSPIVEYLYRQGSLLNIAGEKVSENTVLTAVTEAVKVLGDRCTLVDYTARIELTEKLARYVVYVEVSSTFATPPDLDRCQNKFEQILCQENESFNRKLRQQNKIDSPEFKLVEKNTFKILKEKLISHGTSFSQFKMPRLLKKSELVDLIESRVIVNSPPVSVK